MRDSRALRSARPFLVLCAVVLLVLAVRVSLIEPYRVEATSMEPTLRDGAVVVVEKASLLWSPARRGEVVAVRVGTGLSIKRVVAVAGDVVAVHDAVLSVNSVVVEEPYVDRAGVDGTFFGPVSVPVDHVFLMGDNRFASLDSRDYGPVRLGAVVGRVLGQE